MPKGLARFVIEPLTMDHLKDIQREDLAEFTESSDSDDPFAFAAVRDGKCFAAGGITPYMWDGRGYAWFTCWRHLVGMKDWPGLTRAVKKAVELACESGKYRRIEMTVYDRDERAKRWAVKLGFSFEGLHKALMTDGTDGCTYGRVCDAS